MGQLKIVQMHKCFETLSSELRLKILESLLAKPMSVEGLADKTGAERSTVSHSLKVLKECSYVRSEKSGKERIYSLTPGVLEGIKESGEGHVFRFIDEHFQNYCNCECKRV